MLVFFGVVGIFILVGVNKGLEGDEFVLCYCDEIGFIEWVNFFDDVGVWVVILYVIVGMLIFFFVVCLMMCFFGKRKIIREGFVVWKFVIFVVFMMILFYVLLVCFLGLEFFLLFGGLIGMVIVILVVKLGFFVFWVD